MTVITIFSLLAEGVGHAPRLDGPYTSQMPFPLRCDVNYTLLRLASNLEVWSSSSESLSPTLQFDVLRLCSRSPRFRNEQPSEEVASQVLSFII